MGPKPNVVVVGVGLIGGSLGLALKRSGRVGVVRGVSRPQTLKEAEAVGAVDESYPYQKLQGALQGADLLVLATPIKRILSLLEELGGLSLPAGLVVTDVGSTKSLIVREAERLLPPEVHFIGGHPMAGSEKRGVQAADPFLFQNAIYVLCPPERADPQVVEQLGDLLESTGARVFVMNPEDHDRTVAAVSHLPQFLAVALVNFAAREGGPNALKLAAGGFRDMTRIASSPFSVWRDIVATNESAIRDALRRFASEVANLADDWKPERLGEFFDSAALIRSGIPQDSKGFLRPLAELLVVVEDKPGVIAKIATALADRGINIRDIEVLKVREGEGGTLRLAFENEQLSEQARLILTDLGFSVRHRQR